MAVGTGTMGSRTAKSGTSSHRDAHYAVRTCCGWILLVPLVVFVLLVLSPFRFPITITDIPTPQARVS
jgi:hypothetical protein